jgi:tetratricopeptide (TPR) repeat protein
MRFLLLPFLFVLALPAAALKPGDNLVPFWKTNEAKFTFARVIGPLKGWSGYETAVLGTDSGFTRPPFMLVVRKVGGPGAVVPVGTVEGASSLALDSDGDGLIDVMTNKSLVPGWVFLRVPGARGDGKAFRALADRLYRQYNQEGGPVPAQLSLLVDDLRKRSVDPADADRDLSAALLFSLEEGATVSAAGTGTLAALGLALQSRGGPLPLIFLFLGEALEAGGLTEEAQAAYDRILDLDPKSTIAAYKKARVDPTKLAAFKRIHPDFWALR